MFGEIKMFIEICLNNCQLQSNTIRRSYTLFYTLYIIPCKKNNQLTDDGFDEWFEGRRHAKASVLATTKEHRATANDLARKPT